ncbi:MAG: hypothetical protein IK134_13000 [Oscillospiraceae bacterium]|nr:hypothetical protein [Oscillospiraceae bacterium]
MPKQKTIFKRVTAALTAAFAAGSLAVSAYAATEQRLVGYMGDLNGDMFVSDIDIQILTEHLLTNGGITDPEAAFRADLNKDQCLDVRDLTLLRRVVLGGKGPDEIYEEVEVPDPEPELIAPPVKSVRPTLPSVGDTNILMFVIDFPDCVRSDHYTAEEITERTFGPEDKNSKAYPMESISAFYNRASYGRLQMHGDVFLYNAQGSINNYINPKGDTASYVGTDKLLDEVMAAFDAQVDFTKYDTDKNGTIDTILLALPGSAGSEYWWPCSGGYYGKQSFDGVRGGNLCYGGWDLSDRAGFNGTWTHELGHAMGLPDYYRYENFDNTAEDDYGRGLSGDAGWLTMDDALGDMSCFDKLMYGWYTDAEVQIYSGGTQTYTLQSSQYAPNCVLIPRKELNGFHSEYFMIESVTPDENNYMGFSYRQSFQMFRKGGVRILHCNAEIANGWWGPEFKWNNYGKNYDTSNLTRRVLRLVNNFGGFFREGSLIDSSVKGFAWYDALGFETVDPGFTVKVDSLQDGTAVVTVSPK